MRRSWNIARRVDVGSASVDVRPSPKTYLLLLLLLFLLLLLLLLLGRIARIASDSGLLLHTECRGRSVCVFVCWSRSWVLRKRLNLSRCRLGADSYGPKTFIRWNEDRTNSFAAARGDKTAMRPFVEILWPLVTINYRVWYQFYLFASNLMTTTQCRPHQSGHDRGRTDMHWLLLSSKMLQAADQSNPRSSDQEPTHCGEPHSDAACLISTGLWLTSLRP